MSCLKTSLNITHGSNIIFFIQYHPTLLDENIGSAWPPCWDIEIIDIIVET